MAVNSVSFGSNQPASDPATLLAIQQQQQLANALQSQSMQPLQGNGGRISPLQGLAQMLGSYRASTSRNNAQRLADAMEGRQQAYIGNTLDSMAGQQNQQQTESLPGSPSQPVDNSYEDQGGQPTQQSPALQRLGAALSLNPAQGASQLAQMQMYPYTPKPLQEIGRGGLYNPNNQTVIPAQPGTPTAPPKPLTNVGAADQALASGEITQAEHDAIVKKETNVPERAPRTQVVDGVDPATGKPTKNLVSMDTGQIIAPNVGTPSAGGGFGSAINQRMTNRILTSAQEVGSGLQNVMSLPYGASTGVLGIGATPGQSLFSTAAQALKNKVSDQEVQSYQTTIPGMAASIATLESQGLNPSQARIHSFDGQMLQPGDTGWTRLEKMATLRQNAENGLTASLTDPKVPQEQKQAIRDVMTKMAGSIPFTFQDVQKLKQSQNPQATMGDFVKSQGLAAKSSPNRTAADAILNATPSQ